MTTKPRRAALLLDRLDSLTVTQTVLIAIALGLFVADADLLTGDQLSFSVFYVAPIALVAWRLGRNPALAAACLAASIWFSVELISGREYSQQLIPVWNGVVRLAFFGIIAALLATLRSTLREQADHARVDTLTGVLNRRGFVERADIELFRAARSTRPITIATFDIDHFKHVNDTFGHAAGDDVLRCVGENLHAALRNVDVIGRLGGDEFVVLLPETDAVSAHLVLERLHGRLRAVTADTGIDFSFGAVTFVQPPADLEHALEGADEMMYEAKVDGRERIHQRTEPAVSAAPS